MLCTKYNFGSERTFETPCICVYFSGDWSSIHSAISHSPSTVLHYVISTFRIFLNCYMGGCFSLGFLLIWNLLSLRSSSYDFRGNYILSLSKRRSTRSFSYFSQLSSEMRYLTELFQSTLQSSRGKYRVYLDVDSFCLQNAGTGAEWFSNDI